MCTKKDVIVTFTSFCYIKDRKAMCNVQSVEWSSFSPVFFRSRIFGSECGSGSFYYQAKILLKTLISTVLWRSL
jgi:hypothetical protein